ncbi:hypothetical protein SAMN05444672_10360 [Bacillus sp. OK838]|nr:hypothetical protein SAMN05444672_10360 [Bacillus sp. OK838]
MRKKIGCLHAHYTNIEYIEKASSKFDIEWLHFVDPGLMHRVASDVKFKYSDAQIWLKNKSNGLPNVKWMPS